MSSINNTIDKFGRRKSSGKIIRGPAGIGYKLSADGHFDIQNKRLKNVGEPKHVKDGVTRSYVDEHIETLFQKIVRFVQESNSIAQKNVDKRIVEINKFNEEKLHALSARVDKLEKLPRIPVTSIYTNKK